MKNEKLKILIDKHKTKIVKILKRIGLLKSENWLHKLYQSLFTKNRRREAGSSEEVNFLVNRYRAMVQKTSEILEIDLIDKWNY